MDFDFPPPYDHEVPRRMTRFVASSHLRVLRSLRASWPRPEASRMPWRNGVAASIRQARAHRRLHIFAEAYDARIRESQGWAGLQRHLAGLILRARELDPSLRAGATLSARILVTLRRHGEPLGISDEVLEIAIEMPEE